MPNEGRLPYLYIGEVTDRSDPEGNGRIRFKIEGIIEPQTPQWAEPIGMPGSGNAQKGSVDIPSIGSNVGCFFVMGNPDRPMYISGPWGIPDGVKDIPTGHEIEGNDRQIAVIEDTEWLIQRDSKTTGKVYRIKHKLSGAEIVIDGGSDKVLLSRGSAAQAVVRGTDYRSAEATYLISILNALSTLAANLGAASDPAVVTAGTTLAANLVSLFSDAFVTDNTAHLSQKVFTE